MQSIFLVSIVAFLIGTQFSFQVGEDFLFINPSKPAIAAFRYMLDLAKQALSRVAGRVQAQIPEFFAWITEATEAIAKDHQNQSAMADRLEVNGRDLGPIGPVEMLTKSSSRVE